MSKASKGARLGLGEPWQGQLADFCAAHYNAPERDVIKAALDFFINNRLDNEPEMRIRYEAARKKRLGLTAEIVRIVPNGN